jgi:hypothetical protein
MEKQSSLFFPFRILNIYLRYLQQFKEIFTEEGRLAVKITKQVPGQPPVVEYTQTSSTSSTGITIASGQTILGTHHTSTTGVSNTTITQAIISTHHTSINTTVQ